ncbi:hypothetical protein G6F59_018231 [Rhizopus arrhizus]|nr:hypothetical protein G6F59_018231 [Rhizopus arrhizus]
MMASRRAAYTGKSVDCASAFQASVSPATYAFFSAITRRASVPKGRRSGGVAASAKVIMAAASFAGSPGC